MIVGAGQDGKLIAEEIHSRPELGMKVVGFLDDNMNTIAEEDSTIPILGLTCDTEAVIKDNNVDIVIILAADCYCAKHILQAYFEQGIDGPVGKAGHCDFRQILQPGFFLPGFRREDVKGCPLQQRAVLLCRSETVIKAQRQLILCRRSKGGKKQQEYQEGMSQGSILYFL